MVLWGMSLMGQRAALGEPVYPEKLRADLEVFRKAIYEAHPDPYRYATRGELDALVDAIGDSIIRPITSDAFAARLLPFLQRIGDAGVRLELDRVTARRMEEEATLLPLRVRVIEDGLYIEEELKGFRTFPLGSRIISVNGLDARRILADCGDWVVCDGANTTLRPRVIEQDLANAFLLTYGASPSYLVEVLTPDGTPMEAVLTGMLREEIDHTRKPAGTGLLPWRSSWDAETSTMWLRLTTLDPVELEISGQKPKQFIAALLQDMDRNQARNLVVDVRGCDGQELALAELVFAAFAKAPFQLIQGMTARTGQLGALSGVSAIPDDHLVSLDRNYLPSSEGVVSLRPDDARLSPVEPMPRAFHGNAYMVCDGGTRHAGAVLVMLSKRSGRARVLGEETGTNAHAFTGGNEITVLAPNSGLKLHVPLIRYLPFGDATGPEDRGELPQHRVGPQPSGLAKGRDTVRSAVLELIRELQ